MERPKDQASAASNIPASYDPTYVRVGNIPTRARRLNSTRHNPPPEPSTALVPRYPIFTHSEPPFGLPSIYKAPPYSQLHHISPSQLPGKDSVGNVTSIDGSSKESPQTSSPLKKPTTTYRIRGLPAECAKKDAAVLISHVLKVSEVCVESLAPDASGQHESVATVRFPSTHPDVLLTKDDEWTLPLPTTENSTQGFICIDTHFEGFTPLCDPGDDKYALDFVAIHGLGGHALGSWKDKKSSHLWIRDSLPKDLDSARILTYGYRAKVMDSESFETIDDMATLFRALLRDVRGSISTRRKPIIFAAHSLGGLILKSAIGKMKRGSEVDRLCLYCTNGILCFGVPNQGMETDHMLAMIGGQQNVPLVLSLSRNPHILEPLNSQFNSAFPFRDSTVISFYETETSSTMQQGPTGAPEMTGKRVVLVDMWSSQNSRIGMDEPRFPIQRDHSHMIKFSQRDKYYRVVRTEILELAAKSFAIISKRLRTLESSFAESEDQWDQTSTTAVDSDTFSTADTTSAKQKEKTKDLPKSFACTEEDFRALEKEIALLKRLNASNVSLETKPGRESALIWAVRRGDVDMVDYIINKRTDPDTFEIDGLTVLGIASMNGHEILTQLLISRGANINSMDQLERTALYLASGHGHTPVMKILLAAGALAQDSPSLSSPPFKDVRVSPLMNAARFGHVDAVELLLDCGAEPNLRSSFAPYTALHGAICKGQTKTVTALLEAGGDPNLSILEKTPLLHALFHSSSEQAHLQIIEALLTNGADPDSKDEHGFAPLHHSVAADDIELCSLLLDHGANINILGFHNQTPLHIGFALQHVALTQFLKEKGADEEARDTSGRIPETDDPVDERHFPFYVPFQMNGSFPCDSKSPPPRLEGLPAWERPVRPSLRANRVPQAHYGHQAPKVDSHSNAGNARRRQTSSQIPASRAQEGEERESSDNEKETDVNRSKHDTNAYTVFSTPPSEDLKRPITDRWLQLEALIKSQDEKRKVREEYLAARLLEEREKYSDMAEALFKATKALSIATVVDEKAEEPIELKDAIGRKFKFPFEQCKKWEDMKELIDNAFVHVDTIGKEILDGHYDLIGPGGDIILPSCWGETIRPGDKINMVMWPMKPEVPPPPPPPPPLPPPPQIPEIRPIETQSDSDSDIEIYLERRKRGLFTKAKHAMRSLRLRMGKNRAEEDSSSESELSSGTASHRDQVPSGDAENASPAIVERSNPEEDLAARRPTTSDP